MGEIVDPRFKERVAVREDTFRSVLREFSARFPSYEAAAEALELKPTTFHRYKSGEARTYPKSVVVDLCEKMDADVDDLVIREISLREVRGSSCRHRERNPGLLQGRPDMSRAEVEAMMEAVRAGKREKYGEDSGRKLGELSRKVREERSDLYVESLRIFRSLRGEGSRLEDILEESALTRESASFLVREMIRDGVLIRSSFLYRAGRSFSPWRRRLREAFAAAAGRPKEITALVEEMGLSKKKAEIFLYRLRETGRLKSRFNGRVTLWFSPEFACGMEGLSPLQRRLLALVAERPGLTNRDMREALGAPEEESEKVRRRIVYNLNRLRKLGAVSRRQEGRSFFYSPTEAGAREVLRSKKMKRNSRALERYRRWIRAERESDGRRWIPHAS
jgi:DNA-binding transcriptional ArsR family regulator